MAKDLQKPQSPFHSGERQVQKRLGVQAIEDWASKVVRPYLPDEHRVFHTGLPFLIAAARDAQGRPWATVLSGSDGFVTSPEANSLMIDAQPVLGDALEGALEAGADIGLLGIELATRRRNRVNGRLVRNGSGALALAVEQTFGNCPQYIHERRHWHVEGGTAGHPKRDTRLSPHQIDWISTADTFFIASGHRGSGESATFGMDASHRGGDPGFVHVPGKTRLVFPDYAGNNHFNTIGNLVVDPRVGVLFVNFDTGGLLQLTGRATIDWGSDAVAREPGARRLVTIDIDEVIELPAALPLRWDSQAESVRSLRVIEKRRESDDVVSFVFEARDGGTLPRFEAGQHLPIELDVPGVAGPVRRTYSLSGPSDGTRYRISVKREAHGVASRHLHDQIQAGAILSTRKPSGDFILPCDDCPIVLVSAGIGVTPMVSLLHALAAEENPRMVVFIHGAHDGQHHPFAREVCELAAGRPTMKTHTTYSNPRPEDVAGINYDSKGRIDGALLATFAKIPNAHYMLCGPISFMDDAHSALQQQGVPTERIHTETFGPIG